MVSETLGRKSTPWVYEKGEPFRVIASLELLATLGGVRAFLPHFEQGVCSALTLPGITDNQSNAQLMARMSTTKFPLMAVLMELVAVLLDKKTRLRLCWVPRDQNSEADALTNFDYSQFNHQHRIRLDFSEKNRGILLGDMLDEGRKMFAEIELQKERSAQKKRTDTEPSSKTDQARTTRSKRTTPLEAW